MGEKCMGGQLFAEINGERVAFGVAQEMEITPVEEPVIEPPMLKRLKEAEATFTTRFFPKRVSRKRFVKKMMAKGFPRNTAQLLADVVRLQGGSYGRVMWRFMMLGV